MEENRCLSCGKKLKYSNGFQIIPSKKDVFFVIDELDLKMPAYIGAIEDAEKAERFQKFMNEIQKESFPLSEYNVPDQKYMSEEEWNIWCGVHSNYTTESSLSVYVLPRYNCVPEALNNYYCNEHCFKKHYKLAKKQAKKNVYKQKRTVVSNEEMPMNKIRDILIEEYGQCRVCGDDRVIEAHHIIAKEHGGKDTLSNVVPLCPTCHKLAHGVGVINYG